MAELLNWMQDNDFVPDDDGWFTKANIRIVLDDTQVVVYVFDDESMSILDWQAKLDNAPVAAIAALVTAAL